MFSISSIKAFAGEYEIIFSESFNLYSNQLKITNIAGFEFVFNFSAGAFSKDGKIETVTDSVLKVVNVNITNFRNSFGSVNTDPLAVLEVLDNKKIYLSVYGKAIEGIDFMHVSINFYLK